MQAGERNHRMAGATYLNNNDIVGTMWGRSTDMRDATGPTYLYTGVRINRLLILRSFHRECLCRATSLASGRVGGSGTRILYKF